MTAITELTKAIAEASETVEPLTKSHVKGYTRKDGTVVKEHDDSRQAADKATRRAYLATNTAVKTNDPVHHRVAAKAHDKAADLHAGTPREAEHREIAKNHRKQAGSEKKIATNNEGYGYHGEAYSHAREHEDGRQAAQELTRKADAASAAANRQQISNTEAAEAHRQAAAAYPETNRWKQYHNKMVDRHNAAHAANKRITTKNEGYGYHGEAYKAPREHGFGEHTNDVANDHFHHAAKAVMKHGGSDATDARNYLDSVHGRHLHDEVQNRAWQHEGKPADEDKGHHPDVIKRHIDAAVKEHFGRKYAQKDLAEVKANRAAFE